MTTPSDPSRAPSGVPEVTTAILRRRGRVLLGVSFLFGIPSALLSVATALPLAAVLDRLVPTGSTGADVVLSDAQARDLGSALLIALAGALVAGILGSLTSLAAARVVADDRGGRPATATAAARHALLRALPAFGVAILTTLVLAGIWIPGGALALGLVAAAGAPAAGGPLVFLAIVLIVALVALTIVLTVRWALAGVAVAVGDGGSLDAIRAAWRASGGAGLRIVAVLVGTAIVTGVLGSLMSAVLGLVVTDMLAAPAGLGELSDLAVSVLVGIVLAPVAPVALTVLWFDIAARRGTLGA